MKLLANAVWVCFFCVTKAFPVWVLLGNWVRTTSLEVALAALFFMVHLFGALRMLVYSTKNEPQSLPFFPSRPFPIHSFGTTSSAKRGQHVAAERERSGQF
jgi:hypothetical protein